EDRRGGVQERPYAFFRDPIGLRVRLADDRFHDGRLAADQFVVLAAAGHQRFDSDCQFLHRRAAHAIRALHVSASSSATTLGETRRPARGLSRWTVAGQTGLSVAADRTRLFVQSIPQESTPASFAAPDSHLATGHLVAHAADDPAFLDEVFATPRMDRHFAAHRRPRRVHQRWNPALQAGRLYFTRA